MLIPSIDLMDGQSVQLIGGEAGSRSGEREYGDPIPLAKKFRIAGEIAVIDLDRAFGKGDNRETIKQLLPIAKCRVGGGIRSAEDAREMLNAGAVKVILGTAAKPEILSQLPRHRVIAALDAKDGEVVVEGWTKKTGAGILDRISELKEYAGEFLVTFVEREGRLGGTDMELAAKIVAAAKPAKVTIAGGVTTVEELKKLDELGADAQVGMAIYTGKMDFGEAVAAPFKSDRPDGLIPTVVTDELGIALGLAYSNSESLKVAANQGLGTYWSRKRGLWIKGKTSGNTQELLEIAPDCDKDTIRFTVRQGGEGFCHLPQFTCFGETGGMTEFERRVISDPDSIDLAAAKSELLSAAQKLSGETHASAETASQLFSAAIQLLNRSGVRLADVEQEMNLAARKLG